VHLEADCACPGLSLTLASCRFAEVREVFATYLLGIKVGKLATAAVIHQDFEVHLGLSAEFIDVAEELALVGPDGLAEAFVVVEDGAESEGKNCGVFETISDNSCVVDPGFLIECFCGIMLADDNG